MSKILFSNLLFFFAFSFSVKAQSDTIDTTPSGKDDSIWMGAVTKEAEFPGGMKALSRYMSKNIKIPYDITSYDSTGNVIPDKIFVKFMVKSDGTINNVEIIRGGEKCPACKRAAIEVIKNMPRWQPAEMNGIIVNRMILLPIKF